MLIKWATENIGETLVPFLAAEEPPQSSCNPKLSTTFSLDIESFYYISLDNDTSAFTMFKPTAALSGGLLWYAISLDSGKLHRF